MWLWLKYKNKDFNFAQNLEVPLAKTVDKSFSTLDSTGGQVFMQMKLQCVMKDSWKIENFPSTGKHFVLQLKTHSTVQSR